MRRILTLSTAIYFAGVSPAFCGMLADFRPKFYGFNAELATEFKYDSENKTPKTDSNTRKSKKSEIKLRESLEISNTGYIYHPDLIIFTIGVSGFLQQQRKETNGSKYNIDSSSETYDFAADILRRKRYNGNVYSTKTKPFLTSGYSDNEQISLTRTGVEMYYDVRPWNSNFLFSKYTRENRSFENQLTNYSTWIRYQDNDFSEDVKFFNATFKLRRSERKSNGSKSDSNSLALSNSINYKKDWFFNTSGSFAVNESGERKTETTYLKEKIKATLPWNFEMDTRLSHRESDTTQKVAGKEDLTKKDDNIDFLLRQKIFESVDTSLSLIHHNNRSTQGSFKRDSYNMTSRYIKSLRGGRVTASLNTDYNRIGQQGSVVIENESLTRIPPLTASSVGQKFEIDRHDVNIDSLYIEAEIIDQNGEATWVVIGQCEDFDCKDQGEDWSIDNPGNVPVVIEIEEGFKQLNIFESNGVRNPNYPDQDLTGEIFNFRASYFTIEADYVVQTNSLGFDTGINLFDGGFLGQFEHSTTEQELVEGEFGVVELAPTVTEDELEMIVYTPPFRFLGRYRVIDSDYQEDKWEIAVDYRKAFVPVKPVKSVFRARYSEAEATTEESGSSSVVNKKTYKASVQSSVVVPKTTLNVTNISGYERIDGRIPIFQKNDLGYYSTITNIEDEEDRYYTIFEAQWRKKIPWYFRRMDLWFTLNGYYEYGSDKEYESEVTGEFTTGYKWKFGGTIFDFNGSYFLSRIDEKKGRNASRYQELKDELLIYFKMTRKLL